MGRRRLNLEKNRLEGETSSWQPLWSPEEVGAESWKSASCCANKARFCCQGNISFLSSTAKRNPTEVRKLYGGISAPPYSQLFVYSELFSCPPILSGLFTAVASAHMQHLQLKDLRPQSWESPFPIPELLANLVAAIYGFHEVRTHLWQSILAWPRLLCLHNTCNPITEHSFPKFP